MEAGLSYSVGHAYWPFTGSTAHAALAADCLDEHALEVRDGVLAALESLAQVGPTTEELAEALESARRAFADPRAIPGMLDAEARDLLLGVPPVSADERLREMAGLTAGDIADVLRASLPTTLVSAPARIAPPPRGFVRYAAPQDSEIVDGCSYGLKGIAGWGGKKIRFVAGSEGVSFVDASGAAATIRWHDAVALLSWGAGRFTVVGSTGAELEIHSAELKNGHELAARLREQLGDRLVPLEELDAKEAVEELASEKLKRRWTVGQELDLLPAILGSGESVVTMAQSSRGLKTGLVVVTDRRVFFVYDGMTKRGTEFIDLPLHEIDSVAGSKGIPAVEGASVTLRAFGKYHKFGDISPRERVAELVDEIRDRARL
jgi:hypothetical protein